MVQLLTSDGLTADLIQGPLAGGVPLVQPPLDAEVEVTHNLLLLPGFLPQLDPATDAGQQQLERGLLGTRAGPVGGGRQQWHGQQDHDQQRWPQLDGAELPGRSGLALALLVAPAAPVRGCEQQRRWQPGDGEPLNHD